MDEESKTGPIFFYSTRGPYGVFSNFSRHPVKMGKKHYPTSEHYFQAQKFVGTKHEEEVCRAKGPSEAAKLGRDRSLPLRKDWESVKDNIMYEVLTAKFIQHSALREILIATGERELVEHTANDAYWGDNSNGKTKGNGKNMLGKLLMRLRTQFINAKKEETE